MALEFVLDGCKRPKDALEARKKYKLNFHLLEFEFKGSAVRRGFIAFDPCFAKVILSALPRYSVFDYLDGKFGQPIGNTVARIVSETSAEVLYHAGALEKAVSASYPKLKFNSEGRRALKRISPKIAAQAEDCHGLLESLKKKVISGEKVVNFILNQQGKICPLDFYSCIEDPGIKFADMVDHYFEPNGVWKGVLLRRGYAPYKMGNNTVYFNEQFPVSKDAVKIKPF